MPNLDRRTSTSTSRAERIDKLRDVYQRVQARDADSDTALKDVQDAVLVILEEFTKELYSGK
jgi:hypothetical protein